MSEEWIYRCWDHRDDIAVSANDEHLVMMLAAVSVVNTFSFEAASCVRTCSYCATLLSNHV